ncbi:MAG: gamma carbonic anhydrase family protein [Dehalococcoidales bacterium]|nr:gamma carbonic anhydrase family protein [Dehalococcoidales bacterium]
MIYTFNGKTPRIAASSYVNQNSYIIGDVEIGEECTVWPGAVIRGDLSSIKIGNRVHIQDNCVLHAEYPMVIGDNILLAHCVMMHGAVIGHDTVIGNNATVLDNSEIGNYCVIGAGAVVSDGMKVPDYSLVAGVPAKIKGRVNAEQLNWVERGIPIYMNLAKKYKEHGL